VSSAEVVVDVPNREINGMVFLLTGCYGDSCFVAPKYYRNKKCAVHIRVNRNEVLSTKRVRDRAGAALQMKNTYALCPGPVPRHEVTIATLAVLELAIRSVVNTSSQVGVGKDVVDDLARITVPDLIIGGHPFRCGPVFRREAIVPSSV
jgi:hypothetical protein